MTNHKTPCFWILLPLALGACPSAGGSDDTTSSSDSSAGTTAGPSDGSTTSDGGTMSTSSGASQSESSDGADTTQGTETTGGPQPMLAGECPLADRVGGFLFDMESNYTAFSGSVADGVVPVTVLEEVGVEGDCKLLRRNNPFCDPLCSPGETCDFDGECIPYPTNHNVGTVSVTGLFDEVMVEPKAPTFSYFDTMLSHPAWDPGAPLVLQTTGGDYEAFELHGNGVTMVDPIGDTLVLSTEESVTIQWNPSGATNARLHLELNVDQHGITPVSLICDAEDTGSLELSSGLIADFLEFGISGFPRSEYYIQTADSVTIEPGCVELVVRSHVTRGLSVAGHTPCDDPSDCPKGEMCNLMIQTCEPI